MHIAERKYDIIRLGKGKEVIIMSTCQECIMHDTYTDTCLITGSVAWHGGIAPHCPFNVELTERKTDDMKQVEHYKVIFNKGGHWLSLQFKLAGDAIKAFNFLRVNDINLTVVLMKGETTYYIGNGGNYTTINDLMKEV